MTKQELNTACEWLENALPNIEYITNASALRQNKKQFIDAFRKAMSNCGEIAINKLTWHKVSEELPTCFGDYLVVIKSKQFGRRCALKCWYGYPKDPFGDNPSKEWALEDDEIVTHWMPIPEIKED